MLEVAYWIGAICSTGSLILFAIYIWFLRSSPKYLYDLSNSKIVGENSRKTGLVIFLFFYLPMLIFGTALFEYAHLTLFWMSGSWKNLNNEIFNREFLSGILAFIATGFLYEAVWKGIVGRIESEKYELQIRLYAELEKSSFSKQGFELLKAKIEAALPNLERGDPALDSFFREHKIQTKFLILSPFDAQIIYEGFIRKIDRHLSDL